MQPNWLGGFAAYAAVQALEGKDVPAFVEVPLPIIDNSNIDDYLARADDFPADGYIYSPYDQALFDKLLRRASERARRRGSGGDRRDRIRPSSPRAGLSKASSATPCCARSRSSSVPGRVHALLGENGAGKSHADQPAVGRAAAGRAAPSMIDGEPVARADARRGAARPASPSCSRN